MMTVDASGNVYAITLTGLSVIPLTPSNSSTQPAIATGSSAVVNSTDGTGTFKPGGFIVINGTNLASGATATTLPVPTVLGGSCVTFDDVPLPLLQTSATQISAQIPATVNPGVNVVQVRSLATGQQSNAITVTVAKP
jgi:uncharacterized protein (TIGR03437 family)